MKNLIFFVSILITNFLFGQNWTSVISTNINVNGASSVDIFTNGAGNHIIVQESNALKYYKMGVNGTAGTPVTLEGTSVVSPSISGDATRLYVVYRKSNESYIRTKYSSNGGSNWSYISNLNYSASSMECVFSNNQLHVTYQLSNVIYYSKYNLVSWSSPAIVSTNENGTGPRITAWFYANDDKVYFYYEKANTDIGKWREYNVTGNSWGTLWEGYSLNNVQYSGPSGFRVDDNRIYLYYWYYAPNPFQEYDYYFNWIVKYKSDNSTINSGSPTLNEPTNIYSTYTTNGLAHSVFYYSWISGDDYEIGIWRSNINDGYPSDLVYDYTLVPSSPHYLNLSSVSNDVYVIWKDDIGGNNLRFIYDDQTPLAPTGLTVTEDSNNHPQLNWNTSPEPDRYQYYIYKLDGYVGGGWQKIGQSNGTSYTDQTLSYCHAIPPATCENYRNVSYRVTVIDYGSHESAPSNEVTARLTGGSPEKISLNPDSDVPLEYSLSQNYPNPFNPTTTINYSIKSTGLATIKVFDMLGTEVASLVNEIKEAGNYSTNFNAINLPSGIYFYTLTSGNFVDTKKLIFLK